MKPRVYIETFGCQMNVADSERAATGLRASGYDLCNSVDDADVVLLNTCSVREKAERKVYTRIGEVRAARPDKRDLLVGVMGCVAQLEGEAVFEHASSVNLVIGTRATDRISSLIERAREGERRVLDLGERGEHDHRLLRPHRPLPLLPHHGLHARRRGGVARRPALHSRRQRGVQGRMPRPLQRPAGGRPADARGVSDPRHGV